MTSKPRVPSPPVEPDPEPIYPVDTTNEYAVHSGQNLPNHVTTLEGRGKYVRTGLSGPLLFRTKQSVYRLCAHLLTLAETLPDEPGEHTYDEVEEAIQSN